MIDLQLDLHYYSLLIIYRIFWSLQPRELIAYVFSQVPAVEVLAAETGYKLGMSEIKEVHKNLNREYKRHSGSSLPPG